MSTFSDIYSNTNNNPNSGGAPNKKAQKETDLEQVKNFIISNNIVGTMAGVIIALAFSNFIQSSVGDVILPSIYFTAAHFLKIDETQHTFFSSIFEKVNKINVAAFIKETVSFLLIFIITYFFIQFVVQSWLNGGENHETVSAVKQVGPNRGVNDGAKTSSGGVRGAATQSVAIRG